MRASLDDVARAAGVSRVTAYDQLKSRAGLLSAVLDDVGAPG
jgi:AcrR family transcriptional regulator